MPALDLAAMNAALKELYTGQYVESLIYRDNPYLALVKKFEGFGGKYWPVPVIFSTSQGGTAAFQTAQANQTPPQITAFEMTRKTLYALATIDSQTMLASESDEMAFIQGSKLFMDQALNNITLDLASGLFRSGTGSLAQVNSSGWTSGVGTLANIQDIVQFEVNQVLQASATDGAAPRAAVGYVVAVDRSAGILTVSGTGFGGAASTPTGWAASDFLLKQGMSNSGCSGLAAWLPQTAPGSTDNFYGVNRSTDSTRLAGVRPANTASESIEEAVVDASMITAREGGKPDHFITNFTSYGFFEKALGSKVQYVDAAARSEAAQIAFRGIEINGANSKIKVLPDRSCPALLGYELQLDTWVLGSTGKAPRILNLDGLNWLRVYNADQGEVRFAAYFNLACKAPGFNAVVPLGS